MLRDDDRRQLGRVVALVRDVLGEEAIGAYLFGSAVLGGLRPESDLDVLVLSRRATTRAERRRLVDRLLSISGRRTRARSWRRVELTIVVEDEVVPWRFPPSFDFQYGDWLRREFEQGDLEPWPSRTNVDVATLITMARIAGEPLCGPPAAEVLPRVPPEDLVRAMVGDLETLLRELEPDTRNVVLTLARIWSTVATGLIRSKDEAASWALERLPPVHRPVLARAQAIYLGREPERWDDLRPRVRPFADHVVAEIERAARAGTPGGGRNEHPNTNATPPPVTDG